MGAVMSLSEAECRRRKWQNLSTLQSVFENQCFSKAHQPYSSIRRHSLKYVSNLVSISELLDTKFIENNGSFSDENFYIQELLIKDLRILSQMFYEAATDFRNAACSVEQLPNL
jgi:hypothetical protein